MEATAGEATAVEGPEPEEVQPHRPAASPEQPTVSQVAEHDLTHLNYRAWCPECVEVFGHEMAHHIAVLSGRNIPLIAVDYCFMTEKGIHLKTEVEYSWDGAPDHVLRVLIGACSKTNSYFAHAVAKKGLDSNGYASQSLAESVLALGHSRCVVRSDNEPSILQLVTAAVGGMKFGGVDVVDEGSIPHDPQTNGRAEAAVE